MRKTAIGLMGLFATFALTGLAAAQDLEQKCQNNIANICGSLDADKCFSDESKWQLVLPECEGDVQTMVEMANEARADMAREGASWGGKIRSGPGTEHKQVGSLAEGDLVMLEENTGVMFNGFPWFKISHYDNKTGASLAGYQWGGILCSFDEISGVSKRCPREWSDNPARMKQSSNESGKDNAISEDPIAPIHGNSDEDNALIERQARTTITNCLSYENSEGRDGSACINRFADLCLEQEGNSTTVAMRQCIALEHKVWDRFLNDDYRALMASLGSDEHRSSLRQAQRNWNKFIASFCPLAYQFNQGSMFLLTGDQCVLEMTARQDIELKKLIGEPL